MRKLGRALGVEAMSLYNHVVNKDDLLDGIVDLVLSEFELPSVGEHWETARTYGRDLGPRSPPAPPPGRAA